jgi:GAF domain-containing protein/HAMP domain-containing protein
MKHFFRDWSLRTKFTLAFSLMTILVVTLTALVYYLTLQNQALHEFRSRVKNAVALAALQQNGDEFASISSGEDPLYEKFRAQNLKIRQADAEFVFVYTLRRDDNGLYFVVDGGEPTEQDFSPYGERYDDPSVTLAANFDTMTEAISDPEIYTDRFGSFISGYAPIFASNGERAGVIGIDISADTIVQRQRLLLYQTLSIILLAGLVSVALGYFLGGLLARPIKRLTSDTDRFAGGDLSFRTAVAGRDEVGKLAMSFNDMADQIQALVSGLEQRVEARTLQLRASADVGRAAVSILDTNQLLREVVNLITDRFGFYYAAVFLADSHHRWAVLHEATGEAGRILKERQHQLEIGGQSMVGTAMKTRKARIALDVGDEAVRFANPLLPDTRSEIALPLVVGGRVLGALDVQSTQIAAFDETNAEVLQSMADQIAIALSNTIQFNQIQAALRRSRQLYEASRKLTAASDARGILNVLIEHAVPQADRASVMLLGPQTGEGRWSYIEYGATWLRSGLEHEVPAAPSGARVTPEQLPIVHLLKPDEPLLIPDAQAVRLEPDILALLQRFGTAAIIGLPLSVGRQILGFILIGFQQAQTFDANLIEPLMALVSQAAIVIQNQRSLVESRAALQQLDEVNRRLTGRAWREYAFASGGTIRQSDAGPGAPTELDAAPLPTILSAPLVIRGQEIGALRLEDAAPDREWTANERALLQAVAGEVAIALENARLIEQTERRARREHAVADISSRMLAANDIESILRTAGDELGRILRVGRVAVQLNTERLPAGDEAGRKP